LRFKTFLYHFLVITAVLVLMGMGGYFTLKLVLMDQLENQVTAKTNFLMMQLANAGSEDEERDIIKKHGAFERGDSWIINSKGEFVAYPESETANLGMYQSEANPRASKEDTLPFFICEGEDRQFVNSEKLPSGNFLVVSKKSEYFDKVLSDYSKFMFYEGFGILIIVFYLLTFLSYETLRPLSLLQEYARNLDLGEYIDRPSSLKEPDVECIANILEKYYMGARKGSSLDQNPMSGLPGNKSLYDALFRQIESNNPMAVGFIDANNFSAYNNRYGSQKGEKLIRFIGGILLSTIREFGNNQDRIYHLGGDHFIFTASVDKVDNICKKIIDDYEGQIAYYYDEKDRANGYIISSNKKGITGKFPFMPICIGVATNKNRPLNHPLQIGHIVGQIRDFLRNENKSGYFIDRRLRDREEEYTGDKAPFPDDDREELKKNEKKAGMEDKKSNGVKGEENGIKSRSNDITTKTEEADGEKPKNGTDSSLSAKDIKTSSGND